MQIEPPTYTTNESVVDRAILVIGSDERNKAFTFKKVSVNTPLGETYRLDAYEGDKLIVFGSSAIVCGVEGFSERQGTQ